MTGIVGRLLPLWEVLRSLWEVLRSLRSLAAPPFGTSSPLQFCVAQIAAGPNRERMVRLARFWCTVHRKRSDGVTGVQLGGGHGREVMAPIFEDIM